MQWTYRAFDCKILSPIDCGANSNEVLCTRFGAHGLKRHAIEARHELVLRKLISICSMSDLRRGLSSHSPVHCYPGLGHEQLEGRRVAVRE